MRTTGYFAAIVIFSLASFAAGSGLRRRSQTGSKTRSHSTNDIARGAIAWDVDSLQPRWLEMEFVGIDDDLFMSHLVTDGLAEILLLKREFHMEILFDDIRVAKKSRLTCRRTFLHGLPRAFLFGQSRTIRAEP